MASSLADLTVKMDVDSARFRTEMSNAAKTVQDFGKTVDSIKIALKGALAATAIVEVARGLIDLVGEASKAADQMNDFSLRTGIAVETLSRLSYAAKLSGSDTEELANGLKKFSKYTTEAAAGSKAQAEVFRDMGIQAKNADGSIRPVEDLLGDVADKFASYKDGAEKTALALALFGKAGEKLIPFLNEGKSGIAGLSEEADKLGITLSTKTAKAAADFEDNLDKLKLATKNLGREIFAGLSPFLQQVTDDLIAAKKETKGMEESTAGITSAVKGLVAVTYGLYAGFRLAGNELAAMGKTAATVGQLFTNQIGWKEAGIRSLMIEAERKASQDKILDEGTRAMHALFGRPKQATIGFVGIDEFSDDFDEDAFPNADAWKGAKAAPKVRDPNQSKRTKESTSDLDKLTQAVIAAQHALNALNPSLDKHADAARAAFEADGELAKAFEAEVAKGGDAAKHANTLKEKYIDLAGALDILAKEERDANAERAESVRVLKRLEEATQEHNQKVADSRAVMDAVATPAEKYVSRMRELQKLYEGGKGPLGLGGFNRATKQAAEDYRVQMNVMSEETRAFASAFESTLSEHLFDGFKRGMEGFFSDLLTGFKRVVAQMIAHMVTMRAIMWASTGSPIGAPLPGTGSAPGGPPIPGFGPGLPTEISAPLPSGGFTSPSRAAMALSGPSVVRHEHHFDDRMQRATLEEAMTRHIANVRATR